MVYEAGRLDAPGRPALFATTEEFLRRFGVGSAKELPEMDFSQREEIRTEVEEELKLKLDVDGRILEAGDGTAARPEAGEEPDGTMETGETAEPDGEENGPRENGQEEQDHEMQ